MYLIERRQLIFILFALALSLLLTSVVDSIKVIAALPTWPRIEVAAAVAVFTAGIIMVMRSLWLGIEKKGKARDEEIEKKRKEENAERDRQLVEAITQAFDKAMQKHTEAIVSAITQSNKMLVEAMNSTLQDANERQIQFIVAALQKNSDTIIKAMREPLDGHE